MNENTTPSGPDKSRLSVWDSFIFLWKRIFQNNTLKAEAKAREEEMIRQQIMDKMREVREKLTGILESSEVIKIWQGINQDKIFSIDTSNFQTHAIGKKIRSAAVEVTQTLLSTLEREIEEIKIDLEGKKQRSKENFKGQTSVLEDKTLGERALQGLWEIHFTEAKLAIKQLLIIGSQYKRLEAQYFLDLHILSRDENNPNFKQEKNQLKENFKEEKDILVIQGRKTLAIANEKSEILKKYFGTLKSDLNEQQIGFFEILQEEFRTGKKWVDTSQKYSEMFIPSTSLPKNREEKE